MSKSIKKEELEQIGFTCDNETKSLFDNSFTKFYKYIDNGHVIAGHDTTEVFVTKDMGRVIIEISNQSSYSYGKEIRFKGRCDNLELFEKILNAVVRI